MVTALDTTPTIRADALISWRSFAQRHHSRKTLTRQHSLTVAPEGQEHGGAAGIAAGRRPFDTCMIVLTTALVVDLGNAPGVQAARRLLRQDAAMVPCTTGQISEVRRRGNAMIG